MTYVVVRSDKFRWENKGKRKKVAEDGHGRLHCTTCRSPIYRIFDFEPGEIQIVESTIEHPNNEVPENWLTEGSIYHVFVSEAMESRMQNFKIPAIDNKTSFYRRTPVVQKKLDEFKLEKLNEKRRKMGSGRRRK